MHMAFMKHGTMPANAKPLELVDRQNNNADESVYTTCTHYKTAKTKVVAVAALAATAAAVVAAEKRSPQVSKKAKYFSEEEVKKMKQNTVHCIVVEFCERGTAKEREYHVTAVVW